MESLFPSKKALGHVEVVVSFIIFIGFVTFLFVIFNPFKQSNGANAAENVFNALEQNLTANISSVSMSFNQTTLGVILVSQHTCFSVSFGNVLSDMGCAANNILVKDKSGGIREFSLSSGTLSISIPVSSSPSQFDNMRFYTISCSDEIVSQLSPLGSNCYSLSSSDYALGAIVSKKAFSKKRIEALKNNYGASYKIMKKKFVSDATDFSFMVSSLDNAINYTAEPEQGIPRSAKVSASSFPIDVIDNSGEIIKYIFNIKVW